MIKKITNSPWFHIVIILLLLIVSFLRVRHLDKVNIFDWADGHGGDAEVQEDILLDHVILFTWNIMIYFIFKLLILKRWLVRWRVNIVRSVASNPWLSIAYAWICSSFVSSAIILPIQGGDSFFGLILALVCWAIYSLLMLFPLRFRHQRLYEFGGLYHLTSLAIPLTVSYLSWMQLCGPFEYHSHLRAFPTFIILCLLLFGITTSLLIINKFWQPQRRKTKMVV